MLKKTLIFAAAILGLVAFAAGPASAQTPGYGTEVFNASIDNTSPAPGESVTISGTCTVADEVVIALVGHGTLGTIPVGADDTFSGDVTIPSNLSPGTYTLTATCGDAEVLSIQITVGGTGGGSGDDSLARTGSSIDGLVKVGGGLLVAGAAATLLVTKRRSANA